MRSVKFHPLAASRNSASSSSSSPLSRRLSFHRNYLLLLSFLKESHLPASCIENQTHIDRKKNVKKVYNSLNIESLKSLPNFSSFFQKFLSSLPTEEENRSGSSIAARSWRSPSKKKRKEEEEKEEEGIRPWKNSRDRERPASFLRGGGLK